MEFSKRYVIGFAVLVCLVASIGVAGASMGLKPYQQANRLRAQQLKVLAAVGLPGKDEPVPTGPAVSEMYNRRIQLVVVDAQGQVVQGKTLTDVLAERKEAKLRNRDPALFPVYVRQDAAGTPEAYAIEMNGKGLWGPISGYLAIKPDVKTIMGATFDAPKETPGLGAEITKAWWQAQWRGKLVRNDNGQLVAISVVKGSAALACPGRVAFCVDGVSGATITSRGVDAMVSEAMDDYGPYLQSIQ